MSDAYRALWLPPDVALIEVDGEHWVTIGVASDALGITVQTVKNRALRASEQASWNAGPVLRKLSRNDGLGPSVVWHVPVSWVTSQWDLPARTVTRPGVDAREGVAELQRRDALSRQILALHSDIAEARSKLRKAEAAAKRADADVDEAKAEVERLEAAVSSRLVAQLPQVEIPSEWTVEEAADRVSPPPGSNG